MRRGLDIPWVGGPKYHGEGVRYTIGMGFTMPLEGFDIPWIGDKIPWVTGSIYHVSGSKYNRQGI
jgi:hypothetical protein